MIDLQLHRVFLTDQISLVATLMAAGPGGGQKLV